MAPISLSKVYTYAKVVWYRPTLDLSAAKVILSVPAKFTRNRIK